MNTLHFKLKLKKPEKEKEKQPLKMKHSEMKSENKSMLLPLEPEMLKISLELKKNYLVKSKKAKIDLPRSQLTDKNNSLKSYSKMKKLIKQNFNLRMQEMRSKKKIKNQKLRFKKLHYLPLIFTSLNLIRMIVRLKLNILRLQLKDQKGKEKNCFQDFKIKIMKLQILKEKKDN